VTAPPSLTVAEWSGPDAAWDAFVRAQPGWTHLHLAGWRGVMRRVFGHETPYLAAHDGARLAAVLPLVRVRSALFGRYLISMPFVNYGGPLGDPDAVRAVTDAAVRRAAADRARLLELRSAVPLPLDLAVSHRKITVILDLVPGDPAAVFAGFKGKLRSQIRRPQKEGVVVRFGADQVAPFYRVFSRHMRDLGTPVQSRAFFDAIAAAFPDDAWFGCAWLGDRPVAAGAGFAWDGQFEMTWASALHAFAGIAPNMALYWGFIERAAASGFTAFNFGRCTPGSGTHRFKQQWGGRDVPLHWYQAGAAAATPSPDQAAWAWGPRIWKRLPLPLATALGPRIVRGIP
jgi:FemAB-related protein (PEP-CTERM system-associated)